MLHLKEEKEKSMSVLDDLQVLAGLRWFSIHPNPLKNATEQPGQIGSIGWIM